MFTYNVMNAKVLVTIETLEIKFKDKSIADVLNMTVDEGCEYFENISNIKSKLLTLKKVGLGYINWTASYYFIWW